MELGENKTLKKMISSAYQITYPITELDDVNSLNFNWWIVPVIVHLVIEEEQMPIEWCNLSPYNCQGNPVLPYNVILYSEHLDLFALQAVLIIDSIIRSKAAISPPLAKSKLFHGEGKPMHHGSGTGCESRLSLFKQLIILNIIPHLISIS